MPWSISSKIKVGTFFGEAPGEPFTIVRKQERKHISRFASKEGVSYGYSYESLGFDKKDRHMEPFLVSLEPATVKSEKLSTHEGEEFIFILEGEMEVILGTHKDVLYPGPSVGARINKDKPALMLDHAGVPHEPLAYPLDLNTHTYLPRHHLYQRVILRSNHCTPAIITTPRRR
jgi:mannose-6-phosphate isomerase-like protein (cupin superfamily)